MNDTTPEVEARLAALFAQRSGGERVRMACAMFTLARAFMVANIRANAPGIAEPLAPVIYASLFFPWSMPIAVAAGDRLAVTLAATLVGDDYIWRWRARLSSISFGGPQGRGALP